VSVGEEVAHLEVPGFVEAVVVGRLVGGASFLVGNLAASCLEVNFAQV